MPPRSKVELLPEGVRAELEKRLVEGGFSGYRELSGWLAEQGFEISKSSLHSWGQDFEDRLRGLKIATEQFKVMAEVFEAEEGDLADTAVQSALVNLQMANMEVAKDPSAKNVMALGVATEKILKAFGGIKKFKDELRGRLQKEIATEAAEAVDAELTRAGISAQAAEAIRRRILGRASA